MPKFRRIKFYFFFPVIILFLAIQFHCTNHIPESSGLTTYAGLSDTVKYVGINTCKECHQSIYNTFIETGMGKSFETASRKKSSARFDQHALIYDKYLDFYYHPFWVGDSLKVSEFRLHRARLAARRR